MDSDLFGRIMREAKDLIKLAELPKYDLMNEEGLKLYDLWAPYVLKDLASQYIFSPGYKISFTQVMSVLLALKSEKRDFIVELPEEIEEKKSNIINFSSYKRR